MTNNKKRAFRPLHVLLSIGMAAGVSCTKPTSPSALRFGNLQVTVTPNPIVESGVGACVNAFGATPAGTYHLFPYSVAVEETGGVGVTIQSYKVSVLSGGQEFPAGDFASNVIADRFSGCGGTGSRLEAHQRRCTPVSPFCSSVAVAVPDQLRVQFTAVDDNGKAITGDTIANLAK